MNKDSECCGGSCNCGCQDEHSYFVEFGDKTPSFTIKAYDPNTKNINDHTYKPGKWTVLYFYPADFTFV